jgi:tRNA threonylcarbamoyladenosine biosynthesis protein TsaB
MSGPVLLLDTATPVAVVGVWRDGEVLAEERLHETRRHAEGLALAVERALLAASTPIADLARVVVGVGPGSFIGVRIGVATGKGIALARRVPLNGVPTTSSLAHEPGLPDGVGVCCVDAKRGEVYFQRVRRTRGDVEPLGDPAAASPDEVAAACADAAFVIGTGLDALPAVAWGRARRVDVGGPSAAGMGRAWAERLARDAAPVDEVHELVPMYCRPPDAKLPGTP